MHGGPGLNTLSDEYLAKNGLPVERRNTYLRSLERLREEKIDIFVGIHPNQSGILEKLAERLAERLAPAGSSGNPFVDPEAWPAYLDNLQRNAQKAFGRGSGV
jgi:metallo-beta-lactamase class B